MSTPIGAPAKSATPSIKLRNLNDWCDLALVDVAVVPWIEFGSSEAKIGKDGQPRTQDKITAVVIGGNAVITDNDVDVAVKPDDVVSVYCAGHRRWEYIQAVKTRGQLMRGDVLRVKYTHDEPSATKGNNAKKVWSFQIRQAKPDEATRTARCEEIARGGATPIGGAESFDEPF